MKKQQSKCEMLTKKIDKIFEKHGIKPVKEGTKKGRFIYVKAKMCVDKHYEKSNNLNT